MKFILEFLVYLLKTLAYGWIVAFVKIFRALAAAIKNWCKREHLPHSSKNATGKCGTVTNPAFHRPDPCIYSQYYLMKLGLPVTWDNPDITVKKNGVVVPQHSLLPSTQYEVEARIWNNSYDAPVVGMTVDFSFLSFGVATISNPIGQAVADVGVKGGPNHPSTTNILWTTPPTPGHYCLQVKLNWFDDANPDNNLGQSNTDVVPAHSPAHFSFRLRNPGDKPATYAFTVDTYTLQPLPDCGSIKLGATPAARIRDVVAQYRSKSFPIPSGWTVTITPETISLPPNTETTIQVDADPPSGFTGQQPFNVNAFAGGVFAGGVTLVATKA